MIDEIWGGGSFDAKQTTHLSAILGNYDETHIERTASAAVLWSAHAALLSRAGGQAYYDDVLNITWLADANLADTNDFGVAGINANGTMSWNTAQSWIGAMSAANYLGSKNWRLPNIVDSGAPGCDWEFIGTDCGYNVDLGTGEMAHLFYNTLNNKALLHADGWLVRAAPCNPAQAFRTPVLSPISRATWLLVGHYLCVPSPRSRRRGSSTSTIGFQHNLSYQSSEFYAWAVSPGDSLPWFQCLDRRVAAGFSAGAYWGCSAARC
jgi:hypothetical protein